MLESLIFLLKIFLGFIVCKLHINKHYCSCSQTRQVLNLELTIIQELEAIESDGGRCASLVNNGYADSRPPIASVERHSHNRTRHSQRHHHDPVKPMAFWFPFQGTAPRLLIRQITQRRHFFLPPETARNGSPLR